MRASFHYNTRPIYSLEPVRSPRRDDVSLTSTQAFNLSFDFHVAFTSNHQHGFMLDRMVVERGLEAGLEVKSLHAISFWAIKNPFLKSPKFFNLLRLHRKAPDIWPGIPLHPWLPSPSVCIASPERRGAWLDRPSC